MTAAAGARPKQPDYRLVAWEKTTNRSSNVGAAWVSQKGHITIKLDPGVTLSWNDGLSLNLFPAEDRPRYAARGAREQHAEPSSSAESPAWEDDAPFPEADVD